MSCQQITAAFHDSHPEFKREPTVALALHDGNVRWLLQSQYAPVPNLDRKLLVDEMVSAGKRLWRERISMMRGAERAEELVGALP